jgi:hypothetical protein
MSCSFVKAVDTGQGLPLGTRASTNAEMPAWGKGARSREGCVAIASRVEKETARDEIFDEAHTATPGRVAHVAPGEGQPMYIGGGVLVLILIILVVVLVMRR